MKKYEYHEIANCWDMLIDHDSEQFDSLWKDIAKKGLFNPIWLYEGKILDGRNRYAACIKAGVEPTFVEYEGDDPEGFAKSQNEERRHQNKSQRAMTAEKLANLSSGVGKGQGKSADLHTSEVSLSEAADRMGVSRRLAAKARQVKSGADSSIAEMVEKGDLSLEAAEHLVSLPKEEQRKLAKAGKEAAKAKAKSEKMQKVSKVSMSEVDIKPGTLVMNLLSTCQNLTRKASCANLNADTMAEAFRKELNMGHNGVYWGLVDELHDGLGMFYEAIKKVKNEPALSSKSKGD